MCNAKDRPVCPKCRYQSGNDWSQCSDRCPIAISPHHNADESATYGTTTPVSPSLLTSDQKKASQLHMTQEERAFQKSMENEIPY